MGVSICPSLGTVCSNTAHTAAHNAWCWLLWQFLFLSTLPFTSKMHSKDNKLSPRRAPGPKQLGMNGSSLQQAVEYSFVKVWTGKGSMTRRCSKIISESPCKNSKGHSFRGKKAWASAALGTSDILSVTPNQSLFSKSQLHHI